MLGGKMKTFTDAIKEYYRFNKMGKNDFTYRKYFEPIFEGKDLKLAGLYTAVNENQVEATSLDDDLVQERLDKIRKALIAGQNLHCIKVIGYEGDAAHFIRWHFLKPYFHNQAKKTEKVNGSLNEKVHSS